MSRLDRSISSAGFTAVELLLATALAAALMVGVMGVLGAIGRGSVGPFIEREASDPAAAMHALADILRWDLRHAAAMRVDEADGRMSYTLRGYGGLDRRTRRVTHSPVDVRYSVVVLNGRPWLLRRQAQLDDLTNDNAWSDPVAVGVDQFAIQGLAPDLDSTDPTFAHGDPREPPVFEPLKQTKPVNDEQRWASLEPGSKWIDIPAKVRLWVTRQVDENRSDEPEYVEIVVR